MGVAAAESHDNGTVFVCLAKVIALIRKKISPKQNKHTKKTRKTNKQRKTPSFCFVCAPVKLSAAYFKMQTQMTKTLIELYKCI